MAYPKYPTYEQMKRVLKQHGMQGLFEAGRDFEDKQVQAEATDALVKQRLREAKVKAATAKVTEGFAEVNQRLKDM